MESWLGLQGIAHMMCRVLLIIRYFHTNYIICIILTFRSYIVMDYDPREPVWYSRRFGFKYHQLSVGWISSSMWRIFYMIAYCFFKEDCPTVF